MMSPPEPTLRLRIDKDALAANWRALDAMSGAADTGAAVKADCYGLGVDACLPTLRETGCSQFFVAHWSEVEAVAHHVPAGQIAVLHGPVRDGDVEYAKSIGAIPVINSIEQAARWNRLGGGLCHLMIDTGINRLGVPVNQASNPEIAKLDIDIAMSHLSSADEDADANPRQLAAFRECLAKINHRKASLANSAGIALGQDYAFNLTRPGLSLYGGVPRRELQGRISQVAHVEAAILQVRRLVAGDAVGYNREFVANGDMRIATVSLGYADGFLRSRGVDGAMMFGGCELPILGKVSMDMIAVDLANAPNAREGDWLSVPFDLPHDAQQSSLSQYELLTTLGRRFAI